MTNRPTAQTWQGQHTELLPPASMRGIQVGDHVLIRVAATIEHDEGSLGCVVNYLGWLLHPGWTLLYESPLDAHDSPALFQLGQQPSRSYDAHARTREAQPHDGEEYHSYVDE